MRPVAILTALLLACGMTVADPLQKGDNEVTFRVSYSDTDFKSFEGNDLGSFEDTEIALTYGWLLTNHHEVGLLAGYFRQKDDGGDIFADVSIDGTTLGAFYNYNFTSGNLNPYLGAFVASVGGDAGDQYDLEYGAEIGLKIWPWKNGGFSFGLTWSELESSTDFPNAQGLAFGAGLLIKY